jgi:hypothetical protein
LEAQKAARTLLCRYILKEFPMTIVELFKDWLVPIFSIDLSLVSLGLALWFSSSAKNDAQKLKQYLIA